MDFYYDSNLSFIEGLAYEMPSNFLGDNQEANSDDFCRAIPISVLPSFDAHETQCDRDPNLTNNSQSRFGWSRDCLDEEEMMIPSYLDYHLAPPSPREPISNPSAYESATLNPGIQYPPRYVSYLGWIESTTVPGKQRERDGGTWDSTLVAFSYNNGYSSTNCPMSPNHAPSVLPTHHVNDCLPPHQYHDISNEFGKDWGPCNPTNCDSSWEFTGQPHRPHNPIRHRRFEHNGEKQDFGRDIHSARRCRALQFSRRLLCGLGATLCALRETDIGQEILSGCCQSWHGGGTSTQLATKLLSAVGFTACIACICRSSPDHKYQDHWLVFAIVVGVASGILMGMSLQEAVLKILPWTIIVSLLGSAIMHAMLPRFTASHGASERDLLKCSEK
jgi:hypothetical protein